MMRCVRKRRKTVKNATAVETVVTGARGMVNDVNDADADDVMAADADDVTSCFLSRQYNFIIERRP